MRILVTGGAGYIGTHTIVELYERGHEVVVVDNLSNSSAVALERVGKLVGQEIPFVQVDCCNKDAFKKVFEQYKFDAAIHFAGLKAVGESVSKPLQYYRNNLDSTLTLLELMQEFDVSKLIFSSTACVYGDSKELPLKETTRVGLGITNPYGQTKYMIEQILRDAAAANSKLHVTTLRYFNPVGAHASGTIGEDPNGIPNNLMPYISQVAVGKLEKLHVFGNDYNTADGTCLRDYIHVIDLAQGHVAALEHLNATGFTIYNLGAGRGVSVLEMIHAFEEASGQKVPYDIVERRAGDAVASFADVSKAKKELGWETHKTLHDICADAWNWQSHNPNGYKS
ncbi:MAG TPA: UDP-glucose 4-epimerase GalE [Candidatus Saccharimonadales bacterium]|nr:UDP-glucose 4-epimerase GalE [Candidatus Saccharimonadales bacterium]